MELGSLLLPVKANNLAHIEQLLRRFQKHNAKQSGISGAKRTAAAAQFFVIATIS